MVCWTPHHVSTTGQPSALIKRFGDLATVYTLRTSVHAVHQWPPYHGQQWKLAPSLFGPLLPFLPFLLPREHPRCNSCAALHD